jgi:hypothetical protein
VPTLSCYRMMLHDLKTEKPADFVPHMTLHDPTRCTAPVLKTGGVTWLARMKGEERRLIRNQRVPGSSLRR